MIARKIYFILMIVAVIACLSVQADFIALRKMKHPLKDKVVYLLYDLHISKRFNPDLLTSSVRSVKEYLNKIAEENGFSAGKGYIFISRRYLTTEQLLDIEKILEPALRSFTNLNNQQNYLLENIRSCQISLINEDWPQINPSNSRADTTIHSLLFPRYGLMQDKDNIDISTGLSPLNSIGKKLTGKYSVNELVVLGENKYYFNPDIRDTYISGGTEADINEMDKKSLEIIDSIFNVHNQNAIIVSQGARHIENISVALSKLGYQTEQIYFNPELIRSSAENPNLAQIIDQIKDNTPVNYTNLSATAKMLIAEYPINLQEAFGEDLSRYCEGENTTTIANIRSTPVSSPSIAPKIINTEGLKFKTFGIENLYKIELALSLNGIDYLTLLNLSLNDKATIFKESSNNLALIERVLTHLELDYSQIINSNVATKLQFYMN